MSKKPSYASRVSQDRMSKIDDLCRIKPMSVLQLSTELALHRHRVADYLKFMVANEWLSFESTTYTSNKSFVRTIVLTPVVRKAHNRGIEHPCRLAPNIKPFRDEWTSLFYGPAKV